MSQKKQMFKDVGIYAISAYSAQILDIINGVLIRRFLGATQMGIWSFLQIFLLYAKHAGLGVAAATLRDIPYHRGKGEYEKADEARDLIFSFTILTSIIAAAGVVIFAIWYRPRTETPFFIGLLVIALVIVLQRVYNLFVSLLRAYKEFIFTGYLNFISSLTSIVFAVVLTWHFQIYGFFAGIILNFLLSIVLILWRTRYRFRFYLSWEKLQPLIHFGLAMLVLDILRSTLMNIDRMMVTRFLGFQELGVYSVALMVNNFIFNFPTLLVAVFPPYFQEAYGKRDRAEDLEKILLIPTLVLSYVLAVLVGIVWIAVPWLVHKILPEYISGITALRLLVVGSFFLALTHGFSTFVITVRKHLILIPILVVLIVFGFVINIYLLTHGYGLAGAAIGTGILYIVYFLTLAFFSFSHIFSITGTFKALARVIFPFIYLLGSLALIRYFVPGTDLYLNQVLIRSIMFLLLAVPLVIMAERETKILSLAIEVIFKRKPKAERRTIKQGVVPEEESPDSTKP